MGPLACCYYPLEMPVPTALGAGAFFFQTTQALHSGSPKSEEPCSSQVGKTSRTSNNHSG